MGLTNKDRSRRLAVMDRRLKVSQLAARGYKSHEIAEILAQEKKYLKPDGTAYSASTIRHDEMLALQEVKEALKANREEWRAKVMRDLDELQRAAWAKGDYKTVIKCIVQIIELTGLKEPIKIDITHDVVRMAQAIGIDEQLALEEVNRIIHENAGS